MSELSTHIEFDSAEWAQLRANAHLSLTEQDLVPLRGINEHLTLAEVEAIYLPLSRLLSMYVAASQQLYRAGDTFLGRLPAKVPYIIGIAGSVAVGKSTTARVLASLLSRWPNHPNVELITTDGFLLPNSELEAGGLMDRKGFPESYDKRALVNFLYNVKSGKKSVEAPVYSHVKYDIVRGETQVVHQPDILIVEGLTVLQTQSQYFDPQIFVSDFFDYSIYLDANPADLRSWYIERFLTLRDISFSDPSSYFRKYSEISDDQAREVAARIWTTINEKNLIENISPTRNRADLIMVKDSSHQVDKVWLRKL